MTVSEIVTVFFNALAPEPDVAVITTGNVPADVPPVSWGGGWSVRPSP